MRGLAGLLAAALIAGVLAIAGAETADAATFTVDTSADGIGVPGVTTLREAVLAANGNGVGDTIVIDPGVNPTLTDCGAGALLILESQDLTIEGNGASITQTCIDTRILDKVNANTTVLRMVDVDLDGAPGSGALIQGAVIRGTSQIVLDGVDIVGARGGPGGSAVAIDFGPAIHDLELHDVSITGSVGSAVENLNPAGVFVDSSTISGSTGSALSFGDGTPITVSDSVFVGNGGYGMSTSGQGNGIQPVVTITNSVITDNTQGGFRCLTSCRTLTVTDSVISGNGVGAIAGGGGGVVMPIFTDNFLPLQSVTITSSTIANNASGHAGGGVAVIGSFVLDGDLSPVTTIVDSNIENNTATCSTCDGGGVFVGVGDLVVTSSTSISGNTATRDGGGVAMRRSEVDDITAASAFAMAGSTIEGNAAGRDGGGLALQATTAAISTTTIADNTAAATGGALRIGGNISGLRFDSGVATMAASTLARNDAGTGGGAVHLSYPDGSRLAVVNSTVHANDAGTYGGAFGVGPTELLDLRHVTVTRNDAPVGAALATNGTTTIAASVIAQSTGAGSNCSLVPGAAVSTSPNIASVGWSWFDDATCAPGAADLIAPGGDPQLLSLADNGGPTATRVPAPLSPLVDLVPVASCVEASDQRVVSRPQFAGCDAGSVELAASDPSVIRGTPRRDRLSGTPRADVILALAGNDLIAGSAGADEVFGGRGDDVVRGGAGRDRVLGGPGGDRLMGGPGADVLRGGPGADRLVGGPGRDVLRGGPGRDVLIQRTREDVLVGGPGRDRCIYLNGRVRNC